MKLIFSMGMTLICVSLCLKLLIKQIDGVRELAVNDQKRVRLIASFEICGRYLAAEKNIKEAEIILLKAFPGFNAQWRDARYAIMRDLITVGADEASVACGFVEAENYGIRLFQEGTASGVDAPNWVYQLERIN